MSFRTYFEKALHSMFVLELRRDLKQVGQWVLLLKLAWRSIYNGAAAPNETHRQRNATAGGRFACKRTSHIGVGIIEFVLQPRARAPLLVA